MIGLRGESPTARWDVTKGIVSWRLWAFLAMHDIRQRYRRSVIGPIWLVLGLGVTVLGIGLLYSKILKTETGDYIPFISISLLLWNFISATLIEATTIFPASASVIMSVQIPYSSFILRCVARNLIVALHCVIVVILAFWYYHYAINVDALVVIPGVLLLLLNLCWMVLAIAMLSARFRDIGQIVIYTVSIIFFLTPVIWQPGQVGRSNFLKVANPFYHLIEVVRAPLFERRIPWDSLEFTTIMLAFGSAITLVLFARFRRQIIYWI